MRPRRAQTRSGGGGGGLGRVLPRARGRGRGDGCLWLLPPPPRGPQEAWDVKFDWPMFRSTNALKNWSIVTYQVLPLPPPPDTRPPRPLPLCHRCRQPPQRHRPLP